MMLLADRLAHGQVLQPLRAWPEAHTCGVAKLVKDSAINVTLRLAIARFRSRRNIIDLIRGSLVKSMIEEGHALSVMGNHEFNAICYYTKSSETGDYLRSQNAKNIKQHKTFLDVYENDDNEYRGIIAWFKTLPLWLDLEGLKVVHAC